MKAIGYKEFLPFMDEYRENGGFSAESLDEIAKNIKKATRNYAKRQLTWFRRMPQTIWLDGMRGNLEEQAWACIQQHWPQTDSGR